jgi:hypothetical protein
MMTLSSAPQPQARYRPVDLFTAASINPIYISTRAFALISHRQSGEPWRACRRFDIAVQV